MPRIAARIVRTITDVRIQRVQDITEEDAKAEGVILPEPVYGDGRDFKPWTHREAFEGRWNLLYPGPEENWEANPWAMALTLE